MPKQHCSNHNNCAYKDIAKNILVKKNPIGKITCIKYDNNHLYKVTGVINNIPANSHFHFDLFGSMTGFRCKI